jgi:uncharacterized protein (DUF2236 family)
MNSAAAHLYKEEDVEAGQPDRVYGEEVRGQDLVGVMANELPPRALAAARCRLQAMAAEHLADDEVGTAVTQLAQLANDPPVPPAVVLAGQLQDEVMQLAAALEPAATRSAPIRGPLAPDQFPMPAEQGLRSR